MQSIGRLITGYRVSITGQEHFLSFRNNTIVTSRRAHAKSRSLAIWKKKKRCARFVARTDKPTNSIPSIFVYSSFNVSIPKDVNFHGNPCRFPCDLLQVEKKKKLREERSLKISRQSNIPSIVRPLIGTVVYQARRWMIDRDAHFLFSITLSIFQQPMHVISLSLSFPFFLAWYVFSFLSLPPSPFFFFFFLF